MKKGMIALIATLSVFSLLAGCAPGSAKNAAKAADEPVTLTLWDLRTEGSNAAMIEKIVAEFMKANPGVTVNRTSFKVEDLRNTIKPAINSGKGPDIFSYDAGAGYLGVLAGSGLAYDMTKSAADFGWDKRFHDWALKKGVYDGKLYGVANELEILGMFYNKKLFADAGLVPPKTYQEFLNVCKVFKDKGITPIVLTDKDQWPGFHYESLWLNSFVGPDKVKAAIADKAAWNQPEFGRALDKLYELVKAGYTSEKPLSIGYDDAKKVFYAGNAAMFPTGTWLVNDMADKMGDNAGFFILPPGGEGVPFAAPGGLGEAVVVSAKSQHPDVAMKFVDFMFNQEMAKVWYETGYIPSLKDVDISSFQMSSLFRFVLNEINSAKDLGENIDVIMPPKVNDITKNFVQELLAGKKTGAQCMDLKQEAFKADIAAGNYKP